MKNIIQKKTRITPLLTHIIQYITPKVLFLEGTWVSFQKVNFCNWGYEERINSLTHTEVEVNTVVLTIDFWKNIFSTCATNAQKRKTKTSSPEWKHVSSFVCFHCKVEEYIGSPFIRRIKQICGTTRKQDTMYSCKAKKTRKVSNKVLSLSLIQQKGILV